MPRPKRIEYPNATVLVMNEGALPHPLFRSNEIRNRFLNILNETCVQFHVECLGFCLLKNHYYLLLKTPQGNLSKAMRHLNGVFTQHYNHYIKPKGSLFKHRYKSVLFEGNDSLKKLSRFIHYLPLQKRHTTDLYTYSWSSYLTFLGRYRGPLWLKSHDVLSCFKGIHDYKAYVEEGTDAETRRFFNRKKWAPMYPAPFDPAISNTVHRVDLDTILAQTASLFNVEISHILKSKPGRGPVNIPRYVAMYLARLVGHYDIKEIATAFNVSHFSTVTVGIKRFEKQLATNPPLDQKVKLLMKTVDKFS